MQFEGELKPKSRRSQLSYFANHTFRVEDPYQPQFYTKMSFKVPLPKSTRDMPCILVTLHNSKKSFLMRFESVQSLCSVFNLDENTKKDLRNRLIPRQMWPGTFGKPLREIPTKGSMKPYPAFRGNSLLALLID